MQISITLPLDSDSFLRRECPHCEQQFKWHSGPTVDRPDDWNDPPVYWCPFCGLSADHDSWWTPEQLEYARQTAVGPAMNLISDEIDKTFRGIKGVTFKKGSPVSVEAPSPMTELDDMIQIASPCHPWEPVKIPADHGAPFHCLACGEAFAI